MFSLVAMALSQLVLVASQQGSEDDMSFIQTRTQTQTLPSFASFIMQHGRTYKPGTEEYKSRQALFEKRIDEVRRHNSKPGQPWRAAVNHFTDRTEEELSHIRGWRGFAHASNSIDGSSAHTHASSSPLSLRQSGSAIALEAHTWGYLDAIKADVDQGSCGSCWAIATARIMNAADEIAGNNRSFAAQELVSCVPNPHNCGGSGGCKGSTVELAMNYIASSGLRTEDELPYEAATGECPFSLAMTGARISAQAAVSPVVDHSGELEAMIKVGQHDIASESAGAALGLQHWVRLPENELEPVYTHLVQNGPLAVSVAARSWHNYGDGIFTECDLEQDAVVDHAVVLFGYGVDRSRDLKFWQIKNSWSNGWGEEGSIRLLREHTVKCGIDMKPKAGTGCDGGPKQVKVCGTCGLLYDAVSVKMRR